jgi:hypothetical protein
VAFAFTELSVLWKPSSSFPTSASIHYQNSLVNQPRPPRLMSQTPLRHQDRAADANEPCRFPAQFHHAVKDRLCSLDRRYTSCKGALPAIAPLPILLGCGWVVMKVFIFQIGLANEQTHTKVAHRHTAGRVRYRSPGRRCLDRPVEVGIANRGQDQGDSRFWTTRCGCCYSHLLLLLPDFDGVAIGLAKQNGL